jgi:hypothetical protein
MGIGKSLTLVQVGYGEEVIGVSYLASRSHYWIVCWTAGCYIRWIF